jgi:predicted transcriptional regulator
MDVPELLTVREVAALLKLLTAAVTRRFQGLSQASLIWAHPRRASSGRTKYCASRYPFS